MKRHANDHQQHYSGNQKAAFTVAKLTITTAPSPATSKTAAAFSTFNSEVTITNSTISGNSAPNNSAA
jgi:hypothetical protein